MKIGKKATAVLLSAVMIVSAAVPTWAAEFSDGMEKTNEILFSDSEYEEVLGIESEQTEVTPTPELTPTPKLLRLRPPLTRTISQGQTGRTDLRRMYLTQILETVSDLHAAWQCAPRNLGMTRKSLLQRGIMDLL